MISLANFNFYPKFKLLLVFLAERTMINPKFSVGIIKPYIKYNNNDLNQLEDVFPQQLLPLKYFLI